MDKKMKIKERCIKCAHYVNDPKKIQAPGRAECRRNPPKATQTSSEFKWPHVDFTDFCGEFKNGI